MGKKYQIQDFDIVDYQLWNHEAAPDLLRGPSPKTLYSSSPRFLAFLGAAQTFGTMCRYPYPNLVSSMLGYEALNLGLGGAGPGKYLRNPGLFEWINQSQAAVIQVMAARSSPNSLMVNPPGGSMFRWRSDEPNTPLRHSEELYKQLLGEKADDEIFSIISETRDNWVREYKELSSMISVPTILLWMSSRNPQYKIGTDSIQSLFGGFPQLVDKASFDRISAFFDHAVISVTDAGMPAPLISRFTGRPSPVQRDRHKMRVNNYYPSQEQHINAALKLKPILLELIS
jgi:hypothetical protein